MADETTTSDWADLLTALGAIAAAAVPGPAGAIAVAGIAIATKALASHAAGGPTPEMIEAAHKETTDLLAQMNALRTPAPDNSPPIVDE